MTIAHDIYGTTAAGHVVMRFTLRSAAGITAEIIELGATIISVRAPDRHGQLGEVALGFDTLAEYEINEPYLGCIVGRFGNRIAGARFSLDGQTYALAANDGPNSLHGGPGGFHGKIWRGSIAPDGASVTLRATSPDGEEGFPGALAIAVTYALDDDGALSIAYAATTDAPTVVNLTNHSYFNLAGGGDILGHTLTIDADTYLPTDAHQIPLGELHPVAGTPFDFTAPHPIGERIDADDPQLAIGLGYDHMWIVRGNGLRHAITLADPTSGRTLDVLTDAPGAQCYGGNMLDGSTTGRGGVALYRHAGLAIETQGYPDAPNQPQFPSAALRPGEVYRTTTIYRFGTQAAQPGVLSTDSL